MEKRILSRVGEVNDQSDKLVERRAERAPEGGAPALPCQKSAKCNEKVPERDCKNVVNRWKDLLKSGHVLKLNVLEMVRRFGESNVGFLTLTLPVNLQWGNPAEWREAQRRFKSLRTGVLSKMFKAFVAVLEPQASGRIHWHLVVACHDDIRSGLDFDRINAGDYRTVNPALRGLWKTLRDKLPLYGFGRHELLPVKKTGDAIAAYVGGYLSADFKNENMTGRRCPGRRVRYSQGWRIANKTYAWNTSTGRRWRGALKTCAGMMGYKTVDDFSRRFGPRWAYHLAPMVEWMAGHPAKSETEGRSPTLEKIPSCVAETLLRVFGLGVVVQGEDGPLVAPVISL